ncbi:MAG: hypothetical protein LBD30_03925 [Verrucomicrobiales bacterium]|nr:hypothetical protein [Verrucomicrobiales bacterium]
MATNENMPGDLTGFFKIFSRRLAQTRADSRRSNVALRHIFRILQAGSIGGGIFSQPILTGKFYENE